MLLILLNLTFIGCWSRRETQDLNIATALGFDKVIVNGQPQYLLSVLTIKPSGIKEKGGIASQTQFPISEVVSYKGATIYDAVRNFNLRSSRQLFLGQVITLVIGKEMAKEGINQIIDFAFRHQDIRLRTKVIICEELATDTLQAQPEFEPLLSTEIVEIQRNGAIRSSKSKIVDLYTTISDLLIPGKELALPYIKTFYPPEEKSSAKGDQESGTQSDNQTSNGNEQEKQPQNKTFDYNGLAIFSGDRLVGLLNPEETQGSLFISNEIYRGIIPIAFNSSYKNTSYRLRESSITCKPVLNNGEITFEVFIKGTGDLMEQNNAIINMTREDFDKVEELVNQEVKNLCLRAFTRCQALQTDIFGLGDKIHKSNPKFWKKIKDQWAEIFPEVQLKIHTDFKIKNTGIMNEPIIVE